MYSSHLSQRSSVDRNLYLQHVSIQLHHHCQLDDDEEHGEDEEEEECKPRQDLLLKMKIEHKL